MKDTTPQAVQSCHELLKWLIPHLDKFPRVRRFTLGERLESVLLEALEATVESAYTRNKQPSLQRANLRLEVARHLWRLSHEFQATPTRSYEHGARLMDDPVWIGEPSIRLCKAGLATPNRPIPKACASVSFQR